MSSYYNRIKGTLKTGQTARSSDIHLIQSSIQDAFQRALIDICGTGVVLGESENALKLYPTTQHIDQSNTNFTKGQSSLSFGDTYFRQPIDIEKSSIETIRVYMLNYSNINVTIYGEIRDADLILVGETNAVLKPTEVDDFVTIDFNFNLNHLPLGRYYFVLRPVDVSAVDLTINGDESIYDVITPDMFRVKYDNEGTYTYRNENSFVVYDNLIGLEASYDGNEYLKAKLLEDTINIPEKNFDLCFEHIFSSGNTYLIQNGAAIVLGEKIYPLDTHVTIDGPSTNGDRTDLVILTTDGQLNVIKGTVYNGQKQYPVDNTGLKIAYITSFKSTGANTKVPAIEQSDENNITRRRDILERIRRLEKKINYQYTNNSPTRIKYNCEVDPILANNKEEDLKLIGEGTYGMTQETTNGTTVMTGGRSQNYAWSIIKNNYSYNYTTTSTVDGTIEMWDVLMPLSKPSKSTDIKQYMQCKVVVKAPGYADKTDSNPEGEGGVPNATIQITIKKNSEVVATYNIQTNNNGEYYLSLWNIKTLNTGEYKVYAKYNDKTVKANMTVFADDTKIETKNQKSYKETIQIKTATVGQATQSIPSGIFTGNDSFYLDRINIDEDNGTVTVKRIESTGEYEKNVLLQDRDVFSSAETIYKLKSDKVALTSEYPVLNFTLEHDTRIKKITPYITGFKNIDKFGVLIFKNDYVFNEATNTRTVIQKKMVGDDPIFPTLYDSGWKSLEDLTQQKDGYKILKKQVEFDINKDFDAGTYSLVIYGHLNTENTEGEIKLTEYVTRDYGKEYGIATKCTGGSKLSIINMDTSNLTNKSWDLLIEQKPYQYYDSGILISKSIDTSRNIKACTVERNFQIPNGCSINLYVSNNGGTTWTNANSGHVQFDGDGYSFRWKLEMTTNSVVSPKMVYNETWKYAISFNVAESASYVEYEDYQRCYETPLLNANAITKSFVNEKNVNNRFSEWEFARIFIEDKELQSKIDILISYSDTANTTVSMAKENWDKDIFFSQVFADLTLNDFNRDSVDYDNYQGNVEYDEYNYPFKMESEYIASYAGGVALASPDVYYENSITSPYMYGDITAHDELGRPRNNIYTNFTYKYEDISYTYKDNEDESARKYSGMHIVDGPVWKATQVVSLPDYEHNDIIVGIRFNDILDIDENTTHLTLGIKPILDEEKRNADKYREDIGNGEYQYFIPANTLEVVVSINQYGEIDDADATNGKAYIIDKKLISNEYNEVTINILDDLQGFEASGVGSIGIRARNPQDTLFEGESIGIGRLITNPINRRAYAPYMHTGKWDRLSWTRLESQECIDDPEVPCEVETRAYGMYTLGKYTDTNSNNDVVTKTDYRKVFYPITNYDKNSENATIRFNPTNNTITCTYSGTNKTPTLVDGFINMNNKIQAWGYVGTSYGRDSAPNQIGSITRKGNEIITEFNGTTYIANDSGNQTLFHFPKNTTGELFKIETNIPYTIYDLIDIEYYVFTTYIRSSGTPTTSDEFDVRSDTVNNRDYTTHGHFSKGDICINFYDTKDTNTTPVETFTLPAWGRIQTRSTVENKVVHSWFKKRSNAVRIRAITIERKNPRKDELINGEEMPVGDVWLMLNNILLFNAEIEAALGPQMQMRIYPNTMDNTRNTKIRKVGGIYRI